MKTLLQTFTLIGSASLGFAVNAADSPNIVLIVADDLGFTDTAPYGGEINTPTISQLAQQGVQFTNYHTAASCAPTRAMLLTGVSLVEMLIIINALVCTSRNQLLVIIDATALPLA